MCVIQIHPSHTRKSKPRGVAFKTLAFCNIFCRHFPITHSPEHSSPYSHHPRQCGATSQVRGHLSPQGAQGWSPFAAASAVGGRGIAWRGRGG